MNTKDCLLFDLTTVPQLPRLHNVECKDDYEYKIGKDVERIIPGYSKVLSKPQKTT